MIRNGWMTWDELSPYVEQLIDLELKLMIDYHYPEWNISRSVSEEKVQNLKQWLHSNNAFIWTVTDGNCLIGYYWAYRSEFIDRSRWNIRSLMFPKGKGYGTEAMEIGFVKAKELNCDEVATE